MINYTRPENISSIFSETVNNMPAFHYKEAGSDLYVVVSYHNDKVGACISISINNDFCNPSWPCFNYCYAKKLCEKRDNVRASYDNNTRTLLLDQKLFFRAVDFALSLCELYKVPFRFHVDGELKDVSYFADCIDVVKRHPGAAVLLMTKRYDIVNDFFTAHGIETRPENFYIRFSTNDEMSCPNPFCFPVSHVRDSVDHEKNMVRCLNQAAKKAKKKTGGKKWTCFDCALHGVGCFSSSNVYFVKE